MCNQLFLKRKKLVVKERLEIFLHLDYMQQQKKKEQVVKTCHVLTFCPGYFVYMFTNPLPHPTNPLPSPQAHSSIPQAHSPSHKPTPHPTSPLPSPQAHSPAHKPTHPAHKPTPIPEVLLLFLNSLFLFLFLVLSNSLSRDMGGLEISVSTLRLRSVPLSQRHSNLGPW